MTYFQNIDTIEKAYILGLVHKNNHYLMSLINNKNIINIFKQFCPNIDNTYIININEPETINDIKTSILNYPNFNTELKIAFVRGIYETNFSTELIEINEVIEPIIDNIKNEFIINYDIFDNKIIIKDLTSFYNKIYDNNDISLLPTKTKNYMIYKLNNKPSIKVFKSHKDAIIP